MLFRNLLLLILFSLPMAYSQYFSEKNSNTSQNNRANSNENMLLNVACSNDSDACAKREGSTEFAETTGAEKRSVNKYYGRLNQRATPLAQDCFQIPSANENQADHHQDLTQNKIVSDLQADGTANSQVEAQRALKRSHVVRQDTALMQGTGWGAATVCQGTLMAYGVIPSTTSNSLDFAASGGLALHHSKKYRRNLAYSNNLKELIKKLPDGKNCNDPAKNRTCFCSRPENLNSSSCLPEEYVTRAKNGQTPIGCVDAKGSVDPQCECAASKNCADKVYKTLFELNGFGRYANHEAFVVPSQLFRGDLDPELHNRVFSKRAKFGIRLLKKSLRQVEKRLSKIYKRRPLNKQQQEEADLMTKDGLPSLLANYFASQPEDPNAREKFKAFLAQDPRKTKIKNRVIPKGELARRDAANKQAVNRNIASVPAVEQEAPANQDPSFDNKPSVTGLSDEKEAEIANLLDDPANLEGQIHNDPSKNIFQIVTYRYRVTGFPRLGQGRINAYVE